jgi:hypothetical protein
MVRNTPVVLETLLCVRLDWLQLCYVRFCCVRLSMVRVIKLGWVKQG